MKTSICLSIQQWGWFVSVGCFPKKLHVDCLTKLKFHKIVFKITFLPHCFWAIKVKLYNLNLMRTETLNWTTGAFSITCSDTVESVNNVTFVVRRFTIREKKVPAVTPTCCVNWKCDVSNLIKSKVPIEYKKTSCNRVFIDCWEKCLFFKCFFGKVCLNNTWTDVLLWIKTNTSWFLVDHRL